MEYFINEIQRNRCTVYVFVCGKLLLEKYFNNYAKRKVWIKEMRMLLAGVGELYFEIKHHYAHRSIESYNNKKEHQKSVRAELKNIKFYNTNNS